jgi:hypothetical protein
MNLQEATERIKAVLNQEIAPNTLRKACATGRLRGIRKGEGTMHIRRTEWDVTEEDIIQFVREEYHPRPSRRTKNHKELHIPNNSHLIETQGSNEKVEARVFYRVVEHLYQSTLPIHGKKLGKYDTRIVEAKIRSKVKAEALAQDLEAEARNKNLSEQLRYEVQGYTSLKKVE